jgi:hypothetical protein
MIALDETAVNILETKNNLKLKSNNAGVKRVLQFLNQQIKKERGQSMDTSSMLRSRREIVETRQNEILDGLQLERTRIEMACEDASQRFHNFQEDQISSLFLINTYLHREEMTLVHAKNKWLLRANNFAKQIMDDVAVNPMVDSDENILINSIIYQCQDNCKKILQKSYIDRSNLNSVEKLSLLSYEQQKNPLLLYHFFQFFIIYFEKQTFAVIIKERQQSFLEQKHLNKKKNLDVQREELNEKDKNFFLQQIEIMDLLIAFFFQLIDLSLNYYSIEDIIVVTQEYEEKNRTKKRKEEIELAKSQTEDILTVLLVLIPSTIHAFHSIFQFLMDLLATLDLPPLTSIETMFSSPDSIASPQTFSFRQQELIKLIQSVWKISRSSVINPLMKWINVINEYSFGYNSIITTLSKFLIGNYSLRGNLLFVSNLFCHCVMKINQLSYYLQSVNTLQQQHQMKVKTKSTDFHSRRDSEDINFLLPLSSKSKDNRKESAQSTGNLSFGSSSGFKNSSGRMNSHQQASSTQQQNQATSMESFLLNHLEPLITISLELAENIILQNSIVLGHLGHPSNLFLQEIYFFKAFDQEIIASIEMVSIFYSSEVSPNENSSNGNNLFDNMSFYYNDNINSCVKIIKELSVIAHHRICSVFLCFHVLKCFLSAIGFYLNYSQHFKFDQRDYTSSLNQSSTKLKRQLLKRKHTLKGMKKEILKQPENRLKELSSVATTIVTSNTPATGEDPLAKKPKRNVFATELGQFSYRVLAMLMLHQTSLNICHKGILYLRFVMKEIFLDKHLIEDLFSMQLYSIADPWLVHIALGIDDDDDEDMLDGEDQTTNLSEEQTLEMKSESQIDHESQSVGTIGTYEKSPHHNRSLPPPPAMALMNSSFAPSNPSGSQFVMDNDAISLGGSSMNSEKKDDGHHSEATSVTTKTHELNPSQYLTRMKKLYIPKTFKGELNIKKNRSKLRDGSQTVPVYETLTLIDIFLFVAENHIQSLEVVEQLFLIIFEISNKSNLIKYLFIENNISIPIQRYADNQKRDQHYILALSELVLEILTI